MAAPLPVTAPLAAPPSVTPPLVASPPVTPPLAAPPHVTPPLPPPPPVTTPLTTPPPVTLGDVYRALDAGARSGGPEGGVGALADVSGRPQHAGRPACAGALALRRLRRNLGKAANHVSPSCHIIGSKSIVSPPPATSVTASQSHQSLLPHQ